MLGPDSPSMKAIRISVFFISVRFSGYTALKELNPPTGKLELPLQMLIPIVVFGIAILALGFCNEMIVDGIIKLGLPEVFVR